MIIKNMFSKPIDRDIKGVIKVGQDDDANIKQELEEYVVTRELQKHFSDFFASYKRGITGNTDKMGVWISGFFGSGKSHFLKILSYLLENKEVGGKKAIDYFVDDNKISDQMVLADMKLAGTIPTDVVLFNIDSKSEVNGKQSKVAIVSVLQNVFNEMQGFSGSNPFLADLERNLTEEGKYDLFKEKFEDITTPFNISEVHFKQHNGIIAEVTVECEGKSVVAIAAGNGRLNAVSNALKNQFRLEYDLTTYQEHALEQSSSSKAIAYVGIRSKDGEHYWGAGVDQDIIRASINALLTAINNMVNAK